MNIYYKMKNTTKNLSRNPIIFIKLMNSAGFGNLLFMICNGIALSNEYNRQLQIIEYHNTRHDRPNIRTFTMFKSLDFINHTQANNYVTINEKQEFTYNKIVLPNSNCLIHGYYQSYKYFEKYIDEIKSLLFNESDLIEMKNKIECLRQNKKTVMIHVRRGDYYQSKAHYIIDESHYIEALNSFFNTNNKDDYNVFLFSDEISIKKWKIISLYNIIIIDENNPEKIFLMMIHFDHYIIANSSLSLASYYFRNNKMATIQYPPKWTTNLLSFNDIII